MLDLELVNNSGYNDYLGYSIDQREVNIFIIKYLVKLKSLLKIEFNLILLVERQNVSNFIN